MTKHDTLSNGKRLLVSGNKALSHFGMWFASRWQGMDEVGGGGGGGEEVTSFASPSDLWWISAARSGRWSSLSKVSYLYNRLNL